MKSFLAFFVALGSIVTLSDAYCFFETQIPGRPYKGCMLNGKLYPFGHIQRTEGCLSCTCSKEEINCCSLFRTPYAYDREKCKVLVNRKRCVYEVVQKDDPSKECFYVVTGSGSGKNQHIGVIITSFQNLCVSGSSTARAPPPPLVLEAESELLGTNKSNTGEERKLTVVGLPAKEM